MYIYSLVSVFCFHHFPSFCVDILITVLARLLKMKINLVKFTFLTAISSHQTMGMSLKKCGLCKLYHAKYGHFLASDWLKTKGSGRVYICNV